MQDPFRLLGTAIENRYRIDAVIGEGGFGVVYRGQHLRLEHPVAIKCLKIPSHFTAEAKEIFLKRFREEGKILLKLADAAGVPRIYDYGTHIGDAEIPYLVLEWLDGQTLEAMLDSRRAAKMTGLRGADAIALMLPAVEALAIAHRSQIAHRDIKPANLFLSSGARGPVVKVLDFGIAKAMQEGESVTQSQTQTATSFRAFTPNYAAPEQFAPKRYGASGPWTDVHALGLLLVELLTDRIANPGDDFVECLESATSAQRPSPQGRGARISDELEAVVSKAVARAPDARYPDAGAFAAALRTTPEARDGPSNTLMTLVPMPKTDPHPPISGATAAPRVTPPDPQAAAFVAAPARTEIAVDLPSRVAPAGDRASFSGTQLANELQPQALTQPRVSRVPLEPPRSTARKRSPLPIVLGSLLALGGGICAVVLATRDDKKPPGHNSASWGTSASSAPVGKDGASSTRWARDVTTDAREMLPILEIPEADAKGRFHSRLTLEDGRITKAERVDPSGLVQSTKTARYGSDGSWEVTTVDGRGVLVDTVRYAKDGIRTQVARSGSPFLEGCARLAVKFSPAGDAIERTCQDADGHVIIDATGCQVLVWERNESHQGVTQRCMLEGGKPIVDSGGIHLYRISYDARGQMTELSRFGVDGSAVSDTSGCARTRVEYDAAGNRTALRCIGSAGLPIAFRGSPIGAVKSLYDEHGCEVRKEFVDVDGRPALIGAVAANVSTRDRYCGVLTVETLDPKGALVAQAGDSARDENVIDEQGNVTQRSCFDDKRLPYNCGGAAGSKEASVLRFAYDDRGRQVSRKFFDSAGNPTKNGAYPHEQRTVYDDRGLVTENRHFGADGKPAVTLDNVARREFRYDALGSEISARNFGLDDAPVVGSTGEHEVRRVYDDKHRLARIELRGVDGSYVKKSSMNMGGVRWPDKGVRVEIIREEARLLNRFFDKDDKEVVTVDCTALEKTCHR